MTVDCDGILIRGVRPPGPRPSVESSSQPATLQVPRRHPRPLIPSGQVATLRARGGPDKVADCDQDRRPIIE